MATLGRGQTFGTTEQVTNTKLHNLVDLGTCTAIAASDLGTGILNSLASSAGKINIQNLWNFITCPTNASLITIAGGTSFMLNAATFSSLATFIGGRTGQQFILFANQASFPTLVDANFFKLNGNWIPVKQYDNISLFYDGTNFVETGRVAV